MLAYKIREKQNRKIKIMVNVVVPPGFFFSSFLSRQLMVLCIVFVVADPTPFPPGFPHFSPHQVMHFKMIFQSFATAPRKAAPNRKRSVKNST